MARRSTARKRGGPGRVPGSWCDPGTRAGGVGLSAPRRRPDRAAVPRASWGGPVGADRPRGGLGGPRVAGPWNGPGQGRGRNRTKPGVSDGRAGVWAHRMAVVSNPLDHLYEVERGCVVPRHTRGRTPYPCSSEVGRVSVSTSVTVTEVGSLPVIAGCSGCGVRGDRDEGEAVYGRA